MPHAVIIPANGDPDVMRLIEIEPPEPASHEVVVRNHAAAVNFIDTIIRSGAMPDGMAPALPIVPGVEGAGVVEALGAGVKGLSVGDRVAWMGPIGAGGYASHSVAPAACVTPIADEVGFAQAAALPVNAMTAWHMMVNLGRLEAGDAVLIHAAAGGVGTMALQIAKHLGLTAIASVSTGKIEHARAAGADHVIDYRREDVTARVLEITDGRGVDLALNPIAGATLTRDLEALAPFGTAVLFGFLAGPPAGAFADDLTRHFRSSIAVRVSDIYTYLDARPAAFAKDMAALFDLLARGVLAPETAQLPLASAALAHRRLEAGEVTGKLVLEIA